MKIGVPRETHPGERRVATTPEVAVQLQKLGYDVVIEKDAGAAASFSDDLYKEAGCSIAEITTCEPWERFASQMPRTAKLSDSVPPDVKYISAVCAPMSFAIRSRPSSNAALAFWPIRCTDDGLP